MFGFSMYATLRNKRIILPLMTFNLIVAGLPYGSFPDVASKSISFCLDGVSSRPVTALLYNTDRGSMP